MNKDIPALDPDYVARLGRLTRDYARYASGCGGLGTALGGFFVLLILGVDLLGHRGPLFFWGAFASLEIQSLLPLTALPILWLGARHGLRTWWYQRHGRVELASACEAPKRKTLRAWAMRAALLVWLVCALGLLCFGRVTQKPLRAILIGALLDAFWAALLRLGLTRIERILGAFLFVVPAFLLAGVQLPVADLMFSLPGMGLVAMGLGLREHLAFRRVERELAAFQRLM
jgi:hypothetical protein